jgi:hypothetical protein
MTEMNSGSRWTDGRMEMEKEKDFTAKEKCKSKREVFVEVD